METNIVNISPPIPYLEKFWFSSYGPKCCQPIKLQDYLKCNIKKKVNDEVGTIILDVCNHAKSTQSKKFAYLRNISTKAWG